MPGHTPVVVLIEGDVTARNTLSSALRAAGFAVIATATGAQGLAALASRAVDLVVADPQLHGLSGKDVLRIVREREACERLAPTPFIMLGVNLPGGAQAVGEVTPLEADDLPAAARQIVASAQRAYWR